MPKGEDARKKDSRQAGMTVNVVLLMNYLVYPAITDLEMLTLSMRTNQHLPIYGIIFLHGKKASEDSL